MKKDTAVIVNLTDQSWTLQRTYGTFTIHAAKPGISYATSHVTSRTAVMDLGDKRKLEVPITALEVAHDLCREMNSDGGEDSYFGVFVAEGDAPTEEEMTDARARLAAFYRRLVVAADREWERSHSFLFINDVERRAAEYLGLEKEWYYRAAEMPDCPGCGEKVKPGVAVCKSCHAILDREKAAALGLAQPAQPAAAAPLVAPAAAATDGAATEPADVAVASEVTTLASAMPAESPATPTVVSAQQLSD